MAYTDKSWSDSETSSGNSWSDSETYSDQEWSGGRVKIGTSTSPETRLEELHTFCPFKLHILSTIEGSTVKDEKELQKQFAFCHSHNEWFYPDERLLRFIYRKAS